MSDPAYPASKILARIEIVEAASAAYPLDAAALMTGVHPEMLRYYCRLGLLGTRRAGTEREPTFDDNALYDIRRIEHYRRHHGVSRRALPLVFALLREVERLENEVRFLRGP
jgi:DNA-binding transcriptional MerR regulator